MQAKRIWQFGANQASRFSVVHRTGLDVKGQQRRAPARCWRYAAAGLEGARSHAEGGDLAASGGYVGEAGGAESSEEAAEFAAKQVRGEIDEHVTELDGVVGCDIGKDFAANGDALLHDPAAGIFTGPNGRDGATDGLVPIVFVGFPAEGDAAAAVFIAGFEHEIRTVFANEIEQLDMLAVVSGAGIRDDAGPGNVAANEFALVMRK